MQSHIHHLTHPKYRPDIDGLRAVAVLSVVIFHAFPSFVKGGFIGVDIFFVISGFLISTIIFENLDNGRFSFREFYARRIKRIFPSLLIVLIGCYAFGWLALTAPEYKRLGDHIGAGAGFFSNFLLMKESGYFDTAADTKPLLHLWSLAVEEQFYIVWPLVIWAAYKGRISRLALTIALVISLFALTVYAGNDPGKKASLYYSPHTRFWELLIGAVLACFHQSKTNEDTKYSSNAPLPLRAFSLRIARNAKAILGMAFIAASLLLVTKDKTFPGWWALLPTIGTALLISAGPHAWINRKILCNRILVSIGLISFPLYLWHWPLLSFARILLTDAPSPQISVALVILSVVLAWLTKTYIEQPIRFRTKAAYMTAGLLASMFLLGCAGYLTFIKQGLPSRYGMTELTQTNGRLECEDRKKNSGCVFGNRAARKLVLVWGDSHAEQLTNALQIALGHEYKFQSVTNGSCFMGEKVLFPEIGNPKDCTAALEKLKSLRDQNIYAIIRSQRWHGYGIKNKQAIEEAVNDAIHAYGFHPATFIIVGASPDVDIECELSNYYARPFIKKKVCKTIETAKKDIKAFITTTRSMAVPTNVHFVYPYDTICPQDGCMVIKGHVSYFSDTHHLTQDATLLLMPSIASILSTASEKETQQPSPY